MTLLEAIKTGRRFRRPTHELGTWYGFHEDKDCSRLYGYSSVHPSAGYFCRYLTTLEDILAEDWEVGPMSDKERIQELESVVSRYIEIYDDNCSSYKDYVDCVANLRTVIKK